MSTRTLARGRAKQTTDWWREDGDPDPQSGVHHPSDFLEEIIRQLGLADGLQEEFLKATWSSIVGSYVAAGSVPDSLKRGILTVRVTQSSMRFHLEQMKTSLLYKLQGSVGGEKIQSLRFTLG